MALTEAREMERNGLQRLRVFLCGAHSTGKTTLLERLAQQLPTFYAQNEVARHVINKMGLMRADFDPVNHPDVFERVQREILREQNAVELQLDYKQQSYLYDRGLDPVVYAKMYLGPDAEHRLLQEDFVQDSIRRYQRSLVFVVTPSECYVNDDGFRLAPTLDELKQFTGHMTELFDRLRINHYVIRDADVQQRCNFVIQSIDSH